MSAFTEWFDKEVKNVESGFMGFLTALEPTAAQAVAIVVGSGVTALATTAGTATEKLAAGLVAVEATGLALVPQLETAALQTGLKLAVAANPTLVAPTAAQ